MRRAQQVLVAVSLLSVALSTGGGLASQPDVGANRFAQIPAVLRDPHVKPALYATTTPHRVSDEEYAQLGLADRGAIRVYAGYKVSVVSDPHHGLGLMERSCCALQEWILFQAAGGVAGATAADLGAVRLAGVTVGTPRAELRRHFGPSPGSSLADGRGEVLRYKHRRNHDCSTYYTFVVRRDRVDAISVKNAC